MKRDSLSERRNLLSKAKQTLLKKRIDAARRAAPVNPVIHKRSDSATAPLSFAQERFWFLSQLEPDNPANNRPFACRFHGSLDIQILEKALSDIFRRHEILRGIFQDREGKPVQTFLPSQSLVLRVLDISDLPPAGKVQEATRRLISESKQSFDLALGPLFRTILLRLDEGDHILLTVFHHMLFDAWSGHVFIRDIGVLYAEFVQGKPSPLPELTVQYADYALWQRGLIDGKIRDTQLSYWKRTLTGAPPSIALPTDYHRPPSRTFQGQHRSLTIGPSLSESLRFMSRREGVTLFITLLAGFNVLLHRYSNQDDIVVGTTVAGRPHSEIQGLIGFFVNTLPLRNDLSGHLTFRELLHRIKGVTLAALSHQDLPFEKIVEEVNPARDLSRSPLFQVMFNFENVPQAVAEIPGLTIEEFTFDKGTASFDLGMEIVEKHEGLVCTLEFNTALFDPDTAERMLGHYEMLLKGAAGNPDQHLSQLPLLTDSERHLILVTWNDTGTDTGGAGCLHQMFEARATRNPEAVAVSFCDRQLTYQELNTRANQLAYYLRSVGVGPDVLVGICMERSLEMLVGLLGILKAGGAYVPLDPQYPDARLQFMLEDSGVSVLLTRNLPVDKVAWEREKKNIVIDFNDPIFQSGYTDDLQVEVTPENLAYVIYTSGSTGRPKGVAIEHQSVVTLVHSTLALYTPAQFAGTLASSSICFDFSVFEIFIPLCVGGKIILINNILELPSVPAGENITMITTVPSACSALLNMVTLPASAHTINLGGEPLSGTLVAQLYGQKTVAQVNNLYGPTEDTVYSTFFRVNQGRTSHPPIGRPIGNKKCYILDRHLQPVPVGVPGELHTAGAGLARGYLNRPELTAERFIPDPVRRKPGARLYKTGDFARYLPDGNIEFLGRMDNQIKIRGYRIELCEIEVTLDRHPSIRENIVVAREDQPGDKRLVAYVVCNESSEIGDGDLRKFLQHILPDYMIPSLFIVLDEMPLLPNGKVDRKALPSPGRMEGSHGTGFKAPRTPTEKTLADIWSTILNRDRISIRDNFFDLGGHSLHATRVVSKIREIFQLQVTLPFFFDTPTIAALAEHIDAEGGARKAVQIDLILPVDKNRALPLSFAQQRLWFIDQLEGPSSVYNIPSAWRLTGELDIMALEKAITQIIHRHDVLRTTFGTRNGEPFQIIAPHLTVDLPLADLSNRAPDQREAEVRRLATEESRQAFDLSRGPLLRCTLIRLDAQEHVLVVILHHIISDGWSMDLFSRELGILYGAYSNGRPSPLTPLPIQYADFAEWQRQWLQGEVLEKQLRYWKAQLSGAPPVLALPNDRPRLKVRRSQGESHAVSISAGVSKGLKALAREEGVTLFMTFLAAFQLLLNRYTGQDEIVVGSPIAGRNRVEIENLIGFFVNTLVLRTDLSENPTFRELLQRVRKVTLEGYENQDIPFERLVEEFQPERNQGHSPLFQVMFVMQNILLEPLRLNRVAVCSLGFETDTAKFDLSLFIDEVAEGLNARIEYRTDLFDRATIGRMAGHFQTLLEEIVANPQRQISEMSLITHNERHQLLVEWNETKSDYPRNKCVQHLFEDKAAETPNNIAVVFEDQTMAYAELNNRANQLARYLQRLGVGPDVLVGICMDRSMEMVVGLLGILKAGGAYVPLDPTYPKERLSFMIEDSKATVLLTRMHLIEKLPLNKTPLVCLNGNIADINKESKKNLESGVTPDHLAYVIYTSGSTGRPKGVMIPHKALINYMHWMEETFPLSENDRFLQVAPFSFDMSVREFFAPILAGAKLILLRPGGNKDSSYLIRMILEHKVTVFQCVPSMLYMLLAQKEFMKCTFLCRVSCGGEEFPSRLKERFFATLNSELYNMYGPTEATMTALYWRCKAEESQGLVPLGRPISNGQVYILDNYLQPVPIGVTGELYIGGYGLARGYLNRSDLTTEKFIPNPFSSEPDSRLYKSGDLARYRPDGAVEFQGRIDHQVKVRGFRIELEEIGAVLTSHPAVQAAVVTAREDSVGDKRLVAYVVPHEKAKIIPGDLRRFMQRTLPEYMIPSYYVEMESFPVLPNGKMDRQALPHPCDTEVARDNTYVAPRTDIEKSLTEVWASILNLKHVGIHDNFFELGGHSLMATRIVARIYQDHGIRIPLRAMFEQPTISSLSEYVDHIQAREEFEF